MNVNQAIRDTVIAKMDENNISRYKMAKDLGVELSNVSRILNGRSGKIPESWQKIIEYLDLDIIAVEKNV